MSSAGIGRLLIASLHQAISEHIPARLSFYEPWLTADGFRTSRVSLAGIRAAFSFLRREDGAYEPIMRRAGELAATWLWQDLSPLRRGWLRALPAWARKRGAAALARGLVTDAWQQSTVASRWRKGEGRMVIDDSLFCEVRAAVGHPLCHYYAAGLQQFLGLVGIDTVVRVEACRAAGGARCEVVATSRAEPGLGAAVTAAALVMAVSLAAVVPVAAAPSQAGSRVLVFPFENASRDARLTWLGEGAALLLADHMREAGTDALTRDERLQVFERLQVPPLASLSRATVLRLGQLVGAREVVTGELLLEGDHIVLQARRIQLDTGVMDVDVRERTTRADVIGACDRLAARVVPAAGAVRPSGTRARPPLAAFELYVKGLLAATPAAQSSMLEGALSAYPAYDEARLALWHVRTGAGDHKAAVEVVRAVPEGSRRFGDAQFLLGLSYWHQGQTADAVAVWKTLHERLPSPGPLNNIGVAVATDPTLAQRVGRATWFFSQAKTLDDRDADYVYNLGYAYWLEGDPSGAVYWLKECVRLEPADAAAHALLAQALQAAGQSGEAARELSLAQRLSSAFDRVDMRPGAPAPRGLARIKDARDPRQARRVESAIEGAPQRQQDQAAFYLDRGRRLAERELDLAAEAELRRAVYFAPYDAKAHLLLARIYLRSGRLQDAIDAVKISLWSEESAAAHLVLAEAYLEQRDAPAARSEAERALTLDPNSIHARKLLEQLPK